MLFLFVLLVLNFSAFWLDQVAGFWISGVLDAVIISHLKVVLVLNYMVLGLGVFHLNQSLGGRAALLVESIEIYP